MVEQKRESTIGTISESKFEQCLDDLYSVVADPPRLHGAIAGLRPLFDATGIAYIRDDAAGRLVGFVGDGHDPALQRQFVDYFAGMDPMRAPMAMARPGNWYRDDRVLDPRHTPQPEYVNDFSMKAGIRWFRGGKVFENPKGASYLSLHRPADAHPFGAEALNMLDRLRPHLERVSRLVDELQETLMVLCSAQSAVDQLRTAIVIVDGDCRIRYANRSAEALFAGAAAIHSSSSRLTFTSTAMTGRLRACVASATSHPRQASAFSPNQTDAPSARLQIRVLPSHGTLPGSAKQASHALVFITLGFNHLQPRELGQLFGFSASESALVESLANGFTPGECAEHRCVSISTVRTQLTAVYLKTGVRSLAELMSLVLAMPGMRG